MQIGEYNHAWCRLTYYETVLYIYYTIIWEGVQAQPVDITAAFENYSSLLNWAERVIFSTSQHMYMYVSVFEPLTAGLLVVVNSWWSWRESVSMAREADMYEGRGWLGSSCMLLSDNRSAQCLWLVALLSCDLFSASRALGIWQNLSRDTFVSA